MIERYPDWPDRLAQFLEAAALRPFSWGEHDCALFAADAVLALTGTDPAAGVRGRYRSALGAVRALKGYGGLGAVVENIARRAGAAEIAPAFARRGDVVLLRNGDGHSALGVCIGAGAIGPCGPEGEPGLEAIPMGRAMRAWAIGWE